MIQIQSDFISPALLKFVTSHLRKEGTYYIAGSNSVYVPSSKRKYIDKTICKNWSDLEGQSRLMTPGEAARTEMMREWPLMKKVGWSKGHIKLLDKRPPMYYAGPQVGGLIYIDLDGAYHQLYSKLWLDQAWPRGYYGSYPLSGVASRLNIWKAARNSLVGICRSRGGVAYKGSRRIPLTFKNRHLSPCLWATIQDMLHVIASQAVKLGAVYVNTDGYMFHTSPPEFYEEFIFWLSENKFRWSIRAQGLGEVVSWNNYRVGATRTKSNQLGLVQKSRSFTNVDLEFEGGYLKWWRNVRRISASVD